MTDMRGRYNKSEEQKKKIGLSLKKYYKNRPKLSKKRMEHARKSRSEDNFLSHQRSAGKLGAKAMHSKYSYKMEKNPNWQNGISFEPYGKKFNNNLKERIRSRDKFRCQECFRHQTELDRKLDVHHIDFNKSNNDPENLISLCMVCHRQTNFNRNNWINYYQNRINGLR